MCNVALGDVEREYPNYALFYPQYLDENGLQYSKTDDPLVMFVRISLTLTRNYNKLDQDKGKQSHTAEQQQYLQDVLLFSNEFFYILYNVIA